MSNKSYGIGKERELRIMLEKKGYYLTRSSASLKIFDLIAMNTKELRLIQVKASRQKYCSYKQEIEEIKNFHNHPSIATKELHIYHNDEWTEKVM